MEDKTGIFMEELVKLLLEANDSPIGVPASLVREKEQEIMLCYATITCFVYLG